VGYPACESSHGAGDVPRAFIMNALTSLAILLVGDGKSGMGGSIEFLQRCRVGDDCLILSAKNNIFDPESLGALPLLWIGIRIFTYP